MQRKREQKTCLAPTVVPHCEKVPGNAKLTKDCQEKLIGGLEQALEELDALGLSLAAIHLDSAICAVKEAQVQGA